MQRALLLVAVMALVGCRAPGARIDPFAPPGPQRVPAPQTGSLGVATPQPTSPYYNPLSPAPAGTTWQPAGNSAPGIAGLGTPTINNAANASSQFGTVQPTNPATIRSPGIPVNTGSLSTPQPFTTPSQVTPTTPWQTNGATAPAGQMFNASTPPTSLAPTNVPVNTTPVPAAPRSGSMFSQPPATNPVPATNFNGSMPANDATMAYGQPPQNNMQTPAWNIGGIKNWIQSQPWLTTQPNPAINSAATTNNVVYPNGVAMQQPMATVNPAAAGWVGAPNPTTTPAAGYSTVPGATSLPTRGMPNAVQPAGWTTPAATPTPATSPTAANMQMPATVRGNLDSEPATSAFVATSQSSPSPHTADMYGHHDQYLWLRGKLEYSSIDKRWKLRYIPHDAAEGRMDNYGGSVVLVEGEKLQQFQAGDFVMVQGRVGDSTATGYAPLYHVQQVSPLE